MGTRRLWLRRVGIAGALAITLGYVPYHLYASSGLARLVKLRAERKTLHDANLALVEENARLRNELNILADEESGELSAGAVERAARDELGLVKPGELVFQVELERGQK